MLSKHELNVTVRLPVCYRNVMTGCFQKIPSNQKKVDNLFYFFAGADNLYFTA